MWLINTLKPERKTELSLIFQDKNVPSKEKVKNLEKVPTFISPDAIKGSPDFKLSQENKLKYEIALLIKELISSDPNVKNNSGVSNDSSGVMLLKTCQRKPPSWRSLSVMLGFLFLTSRKFSW